MNDILSPTVYAVSEGCKMKQGLVRAIVTIPERSGTNRKAAIGLAEAISKTGSTTRLTLGESSDLACKPSVMIANGQGVPQTEALKVSR